MRTPSELHNLVRRGNLSRVGEILLAVPRDAPLDVNGYDDSGYTPLMYAVESHDASLEMMLLLLDHGADIHQESRATGYDVGVMAICLAGGDPQKVALLLEHGADLHYQRSDGYDALIDSVHGRDILRDERLISLLKLLIAQGVSLNTITSYKESGLRVLSRIGRFDAVRLLLEAGADETQLEWTALVRAVALGSVADVESAVASGADLEHRDLWSRTPWLVAVQSGDLDKARFLAGSGADTSACGRCGKPSLIYAIEGGHSPMLEWLLETGTSVDQTDDFGETPLMTAVKQSNAEAVDLLLRAGADVNAVKRRSTAIRYVRDPAIALRLLEAGSDPGELAFKGRRALLGLEPDPDEALLEVDKTDFRKAPSSRFGTRNPELIVEPFWEGMIRSGISAYEAGCLLGGTRDDSPIWCANRYGQSITFLGDGRIIQIGGEHEDWYDQDFCIYNDVFVHQPDGTIHIFGYPESLFPPTDFHTATLVGNHIFIIGSLGYQGTRQYGATPVYLLDTGTFQIEALKVQGMPPGWIYGHRATLRNENEICIVEGEIVTSDGSTETHVNNDWSFILNIKHLVWHALSE
jgi:ankyrin repeat protein